MVQGLELPGIIFGIYTLTIYIWSCLLMQPFNSIIRELRSTVGPAELCGLPSLLSIGKLSFCVF